MFVQNDLTQFFSVDWCLWLLLGKAFITPLWLPHRFDRAFNSSGQKQISAALRKWYKVQPAWQSSTASIHPAYDANSCFTWNNKLFCTQIVPPHLHLHQLSIVRMFTTTLVDVTLTSSTPNLTFFPPAKWSIAVLEVINTAKSLWKTGTNNYG